MVPEITVVRRFVVGAISRMAALPAGARQKACKSPNNGDCQRANPPA